MNREHKPFQNPFQKGKKKKKSAERRGKTEKNRRLLCLQKKDV